MGYTPPYLNLVRAAGKYSLYPPTSTTTDDLYIYANTTDTRPNVVLYGAANLEFDVPSTKNIGLLVNGAYMLIISVTAPDTILDSGAGDKNIYLKPNGTGKVKFGTYTAGAATDSTGYIDILDSAGNARKLMVQA